LRSRLLGKNTILSMAHLGARAFDSIGGEVVQTTAFVLENSHKPDYKGGYLRLVDGKSEAKKELAIREAIKNPNCAWFYHASGSDFKKIPGSPIAYWVSSQALSAYDNPLMESYLLSDGAVKTGNNDKFIRFSWEISFKNISQENGWRHHPKGGEFRRWYGNVDSVVDWRLNARNHYKKDYIARILDKQYWDLEGISWSAVSSGGASFRLLEKEHIANNAALCVFPKNGSVTAFLAFLNSSIFDYYVAINTQTLNYLVGDVLRVPFVEVSLVKLEKVVDLCHQAIHIVKSDWNAYETSWEFQKNPLIVGRVSDSVTRHHNATKTVGLRDNAANPTSLSEIYADLKMHNRETITQMQQLEEENNRIFIEAYGLQDELTPGVPLKEITLTCNPYYCYGDNKSEEELEAQLLADTMKEFISYAVGCMFGRYSLDKPGLILANQGESIADYHRQIPESTFPADDDNVIPLLDGDWFTDDISERFFEFLKVTFGNEHYQENLAFIEQTLGKDIRKYFLKDFYTDHLKRYKKRPIYWLFSSSKGSFNALIYMHRYRADTVSIILNDYLREFRTKLSARVDHLQSVEASADASKIEKTKALKEINKLNKMLVEMEEYEREVLYPLATKQIEIDLDDGVKVNYAKFGSALKKVSGL